ncbi:hypothetical protein SAMN05660772_02528 [Pasteurella testudinis DSM 23072]|uniref:Uncharacterized protein n=1 Tax=Pasteurella testudinis DSM 23072 TaxID=1122938 RepID=A0A1W1UXC7_9PAST|nr:hypothetical protein [Pasteurella testudinis]SMB85726.1 hypothetical protein SAMN05660772_02528 [Pasteurella testudinis DSM 23072]SUB51225.1 Uncharacterised protein [Pasteurella testudinis]
MQILLIPMVEGKIMEQQLTPEYLEYLKKEAALGDKDFSEGKAFSSEEVYRGVKDVLYNAVLKYEQNVA